MTKTEFNNRFVNKSVYVTFSNRKDVSLFIDIASEYGYNDDDFGFEWVIEDFRTTGLIVSMHGRLEWCKIKTCVDSESYSNYKEYKFRSKNNKHKKYQ